MIMSNGFRKYLFKKRLNKLLVLFSQLFIISLALCIWEYLANNNYINSFITSSPSRVIETVIRLYKSNNLFNNILITLYETFVSFGLATIIGIIIATILWSCEFIAKVIDPYLTIFNSLPKVSIGPILIIWLGANIRAIIVMAIFISIVITIINIYNGFNSVDKNKIMLIKSFGGNKYQIFKYLILPYNYNTIISTLKINISMSLVGVVTGELLVSKSGIGYLIMYGSQVFNLDLVISGIVILLIVSYTMYLIVSYIEKILIRNA